MSARVVLAMMGDDAGLSRDEVDLLIDDAEATMAPADLESQLELSRAYDRRLGNLPYLEKDKRCFDHLLKAVEFGAGPAHTLALARKYVLGALSVKPDFEEAIRWYKHAVQQGSAEAVAELKKLYRHNQRQQRRPNPKVAP